MNLEDKLKEIKSRCDVATEGKWEFKATKDTGGIRYVFAPNAEKDHRGCEFIVADVNRSFNADFIAHARTDLPMLLEMVEYLLNKDNDLVHWTNSKVKIDLKKIAEKYK